MQIKEVHKIYDKDCQEWLKTIGQKVCFNSYDSTAAYVRLRMFGIYLGEGYTPGHQYEVYFWRSKEDMTVARAKPGRAAKRLIRKYVKTPDEPVQYPNDKFPKKIHYTKNPVFKSGIEYTGWWAHMDINSAEPYLVTKYLPELKKSIYNMYKRRKKKPRVKLTMTSINGNLRWTHGSIYNRVNQDLYNWVDTTWKECEKLGYIPIYSRIDALIVAIPEEDSILPVEEGTRIGQWKIKREYGTIRPGTSSVNFDTNMKLIESKNLGEIKPSRLLNIVIHCNIFIEKGVEVDESRNPEGLED